MPAIRAISICIFRHGDAILVEQDHDAIKEDWWCRPLGGGIEHGEHSVDAMRREIREELSEEVEELRLLGVLENIFTCDGGTGHEIVFVYDGLFADKSVYSRESLDAFEHGNSTHFHPRWRTREEIRRLGFRLVPDGLDRLLDEEGVA